MGSCKATSVLLLTLALLGQTTGVALADPCLVVYPTGSCTYHYDISEYYLVTAGHPLYQSAFDRGGAVLIETNTDEIAYNIYQAPGLTAFAVSSGGQEGYFFEGNTFDLVVDGFHNDPTTFVNVRLVVESLPTACPPNVTIDGAPIGGDQYALGDLVVSTPTGNGHNYSDSMLLEVGWDSCAEIQFWAYSDENGNGVHDGGECFSAYSHDTTVPTPAGSIGKLKASFRVD